MTLRRLRGLAVAVVAWLALSPDAAGQSDVRQIQQRNVEQLEKRLAGWERELQRIDKSFQGFTRARSELSGLCREAEELTRAAAGLRSQAEEQLRRLEERLREFDRAARAFDEASSRAAATENPASSGLGAGLERMQTALDSAATALETLTGLNEQLDAIVADPDTQSRAAAIEQKLSQGRTRLQSSRGSAAKALRANASIDESLERGWRSEMQQELEGLELSRTTATASHDQKLLDGLIARARSALAKARTLRETAQRQRQSVGAKTFEHSLLRRPEYSLPMPEVLHDAKEAESSIRDLARGGVGTGRTDIAGARNRMERARESASLPRSPAPSAPPPSSSALGTGAATGGGAAPSGSTPPAGAGQPSASPPTSSASGHAAAPAAPDHYGGLQITPQVREIRVGEAVQLRAIDHGGREYSGAVWSGSNTRALAVSGDGMIIGRKANEEAMVMVRVEDMGAILEVKVVGPDDTRASSSPPQAPGGFVGTGTGAPDPGEQTGSTSAPGSAPGAATGAQPVSTPDPPGGAGTERVASTGSGAPSSGGQPAGTGSEGETPGMDTAAGADTGSLGAGGAVPGAASEDAAVGPLLPGLGLLEGDSSQPGGAGSETGDAAPDGDATEMEPLGEAWGSAPPTGPGAAAGEDVLSATNQGEGGEAAESAVAGWGEEEPLPVESLPDAGSEAGDAAGSDSGWGEAWEEAPVEEGGATGGSGGVSDGGADTGWGEVWEEDSVEESGATGGSEASGAGSGSGWGEAWESAPVEESGTTAGPVGSGSGADSGWGEEWEAAPVEVAGGDERPGSGLELLGEASQSVAEPPASPVGPRGDPLAGDWISARQALGQEEDPGLLRRAGCDLVAGGFRPPFQQREAAIRHERACRLAELERSRVTSAARAVSGGVRITPTARGYSARTLMADDWQNSGEAGRYGYIHQNNHNLVVRNVARGTELMRLQRVGEGRYAGQCLVAKTFDAQPAVWAKCTLQLVAEGKALLSIWWNPNLLWVVYEERDAWARLGASAPPIRFSGMIRVRERAGSASGTPDVTASGAGSSGNCWVGCKPAVRPLSCAVACDGQFSATTALANGGRTDYKLKNASWERCAAKMRELGQAGW